MQVYANVSNQQERIGIGLGVLLSQSVGEMEINKYTGGQSRSCGVVMYQKTARDTEIVTDFKCCRVKETKVLNRKMTARTGYRKKAKRERNRPTETLRFQYLRSRLIAIRIRLRMTTATKAMVTWIQRGSNLHIG